jgi:uncharacterized protein YecT (DUF1311 family)
VQKEKPFSQSYYQCEKERGGTTAGISSCLEKELKHQDAKLNSSYQKVKNSIQPFRVKSLKRLQRVWISYRDEKCAFFNHKESGSSGSLDEQMCLIKATILRTKELEEIF